MKVRYGDRRTRSAGLSGLALLLILAVAGCGPQGAGGVGTMETPPVWPEPPDPPRITYLGQVVTETDLAKGKSWAQGLGELVFGKADIGVMVSPYAVAVDAAGRMFVADSGGAVVHMFNLSTRAYSQFSALSDGQRLQKPVGLTVLGDRLYVVDSILGQVCVFSKDGKFLFAFGASRFERPSGIAGWGPEGIVYVTDTGRHAVCVFDQSGKFIRQMGSRGLGPGQFNFPTHLWVDRAGQLYVSDTLNYRVQVFTADGVFARMFGLQGDRPGNFAHPAGIATDRAGRICVIDRQFENVQIFNPDGQILMAFGNEGTGPGQFWLPGGIFIDSHNRIYVADSFNKRIQIFAFLEDSEG